MRDILITGVSLALSVLALAKAGLYLPVTLTAIYAFLTIRSDESCIADYLVRCVRYFLTKQQTYFWKDKNNENKYL